MGAAVARGPLHERGNLWHLVCASVMFPLTSALGRVHNEGMENLTRPGPMLVVGNHISHIDPIYDTVMVRRTGRLPHVLAKSSLWEIPVLRNALTATGQIPVERGKGAGQAALAPAIAALDAGKVVIIYPEGTVTKDPDHWPMRPRPGVAALALAGDYPVIPLAHWGTHRVYSSYAKGGEKGQFRPLPRKDILIRAGEEVDLSDLRGRGSDPRALRDATYRIMGAVRDLVGELRGEQPPADFYDPKKARIR